MHHSIKPDEIKAQRDKLFAEYWESVLEVSREVGLVPSDPSLQIIKDASEEAFQKGFVHGLIIGGKHGAKLTGAAIAADVQDILDSAGEEH